MTDTPDTLRDYAPPEPAAKPQPTPGFVSMLVRHDEGPAGKHCRTCRLLVTRHDGPWTVHQCSRFLPTGAARTRWRLKWPACGLYTDGTPIQPRKPA